MPEAQECVMCRIVSGGAPARVVYEDEQTLGILDIRPRWAKGQCLVLPKRHVEQFYQLEDGEIEQLFKGVKQVAQRIRAVFSPEFVCTFSRGQGVPHAHIMVFPSSQGDLLDSFIQLMIAAARLTRGSPEEELDDIACKLREATV